ncbi:MAG: hypothetical protein ACK5GN_14155 [Pseudomonadota bacterium]|jgi:ABC-type uncharacterized transport system auxiliary subunit
MKHRPKIRNFLACIIITTVALAGCSKTAPLVTPEFQVAVSDNKRVHEAIRNALVQRKWAIVKNEPNAIEATYTRGNEHSAHIRVTHTGKKIKIIHVDSHQLEYSQGGSGPIIHRWYNTWVSNLERDIQVAIGAGL